MNGQASSQLERYKLYLDCVRQELLSRIAERDSAGARQAIEDLYSVLSQIESSISGNGEDVPPPALT